MNSMQVLAHLPVFVTSRVQSTKSSGKPVRSRFICLLLVVTKRFLRIYGNATNVTDQLVAVAPKTAAAPDTVVAALE
ncbi:MAG: hypothetical protein ACI9R3_001886 [Verrucomicrobiales bacterium]|jgi:hypothetical protein